MVNFIEILTAPANVEWCEAKVARYTVTPLISEFGNTISNSIYCIVSGIGFRRIQQQNLPWPFTYTEAFMMIVGLGSMLFHGSELLIGEMFDEIPMSFQVAGYLFILSEFHPLFRSGTTSKKVIYSLFFTLSIASWISYLYTGHFDIFTHVFGVQVAFCTVMIGLHKPPPGGRGLWYLSTALALSGKTVWEYERELYNLNKCPSSATDPRYYLHVFWHFLSAGSHISQMAYLARLYHNREGAVKTTKRS